MTETDGKTEGSEMDGDEEGGSQEYDVEEGRLIFFGVFGTLGLMYFFLWIGQPFFTLVVLAGAIALAIMMIGDGGNLQEGGEPGEQQQQQSSNSGPCLDA